MLKKLRKMLKRKSPSIGRMTVTLEIASGGYTVLRGNYMLGRVKRWRGTYNHSNGRTYRYSSWAGFPVHGHGRMQFKTRKEAIAWLAEIQEGR